MHPQARPLRSARRNQQQQLHQHKEQEQGKQQGKGKVSHLDSLYAFQAHSSGWPRCSCLLVASFSSLWWACGFSRYHRHSLNLPRGKVSTVRGLIFGWRFRPRRSNSGGVGAKRGGQVEAQSTSRLNRAFTLIVGRRGGTSAMPPASSPDNECPLSRPFRTYSLLVDPIRSVPFRS